MAAGGLLGGLAAGLLKIKQRGILLLSSCTIIGVCLGSLGSQNRAWTLGATLLLMGASAGIANVHIGAWIQQRVEPAVRGRVMSVLMLSVYGIMPISMAAAGFLVAWSLQWMYLLAAACLLLVTGFGALHKEVRSI
jgi:MFS family permease